MQFHKTHFSLCDDGNKRIIAYFDGSCLHGGLVDRLKGIVSLYEISIKLNIPLKINFTSPFLLNDYLTISPIFLASEGDLKWALTSTKIINAINITDNKLEYDIASSAQKHLACYSNMDYVNNKSIWKNHFYTLFSPTKKLNDELDAYNDLNYDLAFHTRFTSLLGDFKDVSKKKISFEQEKILMDQVKNTIINRIKINGVESASVFSDSKKFLAYLKEDEKHSALFTILDNKIPEHSDRLDSSNDGHLKTFVDFFLLSRFNKIELIQHGEMYSSAFSKYASIIGNSTFTIINN